MISSVMKGGGGQYSGITVKAMQEMKVEVLQQQVYELEAQLKEKNKQIP